MNERKADLTAEKGNREDWRPPEMRRRGRRRWWAWAIGALLALLAAAYLLGAFGQPDEGEPEQPVVDEPLPTVSASGPVVPARRAQLSFTTAGRLSRITVEPGDRVKEGQLLAQLEPSTVQSSSFGGGAPGPGAPEFYLLAPFDGTVGLVPVREWETVAAGAPVVMLGDLSHLRVEIEDLSETDVGRLQEGQKAEVVFESFPGSRVGARVARIAPMNNAKGGGVNYDVVVEFTDRDLPPLRWGMTAHVDILVGEER